MDRNLQERLVGGIVLVIVAVLVIPEFLSGPRQQESITQGLELPAEGEAELQTVTIRMDRSSDKPQSPVASPQTETGDSDPSNAAADNSRAAKPSKSQAAATPARQPARHAATAAETNQGFAVQVGSFSQQENARRLASTLRQQGYSITVTEHRSRGRTLHRVRIGPLKTRAEADTMAARLSREGQQAAVVPLP